MHKGYYIKNVVKSTFLVVPCIGVIFGIGMLMVSSQNTVSLFSGWFVYTVVSLFLTSKVLHLYERISQLEEGR